MKDRGASTGEVLFWVVAIGLFTLVSLTGKALGWWGGQESAFDKCVQQSMDIQRETGSADRGAAEQGCYASGLQP